MLILLTSPPKRNAPQAQIETTVSVVAGSHDGRPAFDIVPYTAVVLALLAAKPTSEMAE